MPNELQSSALFPPKVSIPWTT
ncbi:hypothetical protein Bhyg_10173 [Pseudolycoriella hygida]|uniref:Uncharacterized protein n=1 Tax=Pseudolycoriella hygida TaxID=35572 RepID=A0A9Q0RZ21_9DIPT|nr:hypothetical protein Bhyg_10173 [Pseudolycoriella hygida]